MPLDAARQLATILGVLTEHGAAAVIPRLEEALRTGAPLRLPPRATPAVSLADEALPAPLRDIEVASGLAADYDQWLQGGAA